MKQKKSIKAESPPKNVFDHIRQIRENKTDGYIESLTDSEKNNFNKFVIVLGIGYDKAALESACVLSKYMDILTIDRFYDVAKAFVPPTRNFVKWIKSDKPKLISNELIRIIATHFKVSNREAKKYGEAMIATDAGLNELTDICSRHGFSDDEIEKFFEIK